MYIHTSCIASTRAVLYYSVLLYCLLVQRINTRRCGCQPLGQGVESRIGERMTLSIGKEI